MPHTHTHQSKRNHPSHHPRGSQTARCRRRCRQTARRGARQTTTRRRDSWSGCRHRNRPCPNSRRASSRAARATAAASDRQRHRAAGRDHGGPRRRHKAHAAQSVHRRENYCYQLPIRVCIPVHIIIHHTHHDVIIMHHVIMNHESLGMDLAPPGPGQNCAKMPKT